MILVPCQRVPPLLNIGTVLCQPPLDHVMHVSMLREYYVQKHQLLLLLLQVLQVAVKN